MFHWFKYYVIEFCRIIYVYNIIGTYLFFVQQNNLCYIFLFYIIMFILIILFFLIICICLHFANYNHLILSFKTMSLFTYVFKNYFHSSLTYYLFSILSHSYILYISILLLIIFLLLVLLLNFLYITLSPKKTMLYLLIKWLNSSVNIYQIFLFFFCLNSFHCLLHFLFSIIQPNHVFIKRHS